MVPIGFTLQPDAEFLELCGPLLEQVDYYEVTPETLWFENEDGRLLPNGYFRRFAELKKETNKPFVAHGVGLSLGTASRDDGPRRQRWLERLRADHETFDFRWYTEHLGASSLDGLAMTLPMPIPMTGQAARVVRGRLRAMQRIVPDVGIENSVSYFLLGEPLDEPKFLRRIVKHRRTHLLLDLHNVYAMSVNFGFDPRRYIDALDLDRVIEIHVSGGVDSDPAWFDDGRAFRLDSHDDSIPRPVWDLLEYALPRCPKVRGVTLERMEGTVDAASVLDLQDELQTLRRVVRKLRAG